MCAHPDVAVEPRLHSGSASKRHLRSIATRQSIAARVHLQLLGSSQRTGWNQATRRTQVQQPQPLPSSRRRHKQQRLAFWTVEQHRLLPRACPVQATGARHQIFQRIVRNHRAFVQSSQLIIKESERWLLVARLVAQNQPRHRETSQTAQQKQRQRFHWFLLCGQSDRADHVAFANAHREHDGRLRLRFGLLGADLSP